MCRVRYRLHTVAVDPTGAKCSSTDSSSSSNTPNEFSSYTFVERTLMAIGSGGGQTKRPFPRKEELTDADIHHQHVEDPLIGRCVSKISTAPNASIYLTPGARAASGTAANPAALTAVACMSPSKTLRFRGISSITGVPMSKTRKKNQSVRLNAVW